jgi:hypothetical protein
MSDSNYTSVLRKTEAAWGDGGSGDAERVRVTGETMKFAINNIRSEEIRSDRLTPDTLQVGARANGGFGMELSYSAFDGELAALLFTDWVENTAITNSASDTEITEVTNSSDTVTVASGGASFKAGHYVLAAGFTNANNNAFFRVSSSTATTIVYGGTPTLTDEAAPPAGAVVKVMGFMGASGDITATSTGLGSTLLDFTTLGLSVGQWVKIGGGQTVEKFATAALNSFARITAIAANAITLDNRPTGWTTDSGTSKTIVVWVSEYIRPGVTQTSFAYEKSISSMDTVTYRKFRGMIPNSLSLTIEAGQIVNGSFDFLGKDEVTSLSSMDASPDDAPQNSVLNAVNDVARISEGGSPVGSATPVRRQTLTISNNLREQQAIGTLGLIGVGVGDFDVTGEIMTYFGDATLYDKFVAGTATSMATIIEGGVILSAGGSIGDISGAYIFDICRAKYEDAEANSSSRNQDVMVTLQYRALLDSTVTGTAFQIARINYK